MEKFKNLDSIISMALDEDLSDSGDVTSEAVFTSQVFDYSLVAKESGILCGIDIFTRVMKLVDDSVQVIRNFNDIDRIKSGDIIAQVSGPVVSILKGERTALNFLSHLSAIATKTALFVEKSGGKVTILDTRKTLPGYRELQKYAVRCGGGENHRMGLYDMVMIKDNHIDAAGGITSAVSSIRAKWGDRFRIEVETRNISEVREALDCDVDRIMLDNMSNELTAEAVSLIAGMAETEASGNMTIERIPEVSATGVNFISFGELTNSVKAFDFSLKEIK